MPATVTFAARPATLAPEPGQALSAGERAAIQQWARSAIRFYVLVTALAQFDPRHDAFGDVDMRAAASLLDKVEALSDGVPRDGVPEARLTPTGGQLLLTDAELVIVKRAWLQYRPNVQWARAREVQAVDQFLANVALPDVAAPEVAVP